MKKTIIIAATTLTLVACAGQKQAEPEKTTAQQLLERDSSDVKNVCGDYPAIMGFDLGGIEMGDQKNLDSVPFTRMTEEIIAHHLRGGIVTLSWHPRNPVTQKFPEGTAWDVRDSAVVKKILTDSLTHEKFEGWMQRVSDFLATLKTADGKKVPVIFRPWHENSGSWFWWGEKLCSVDEYKALWNLLQDKLKADGFDNLVWSYSPGCQDNLTAERLLDRYPGDDRVDMIGLDGYQWVPEEKDIFIARTKQNLQVLCEVAQAHGLIPAMTETGMKNLTQPDWWSTTLLPAVQDYPISYLLTWRNYKEEWFGPSTSKPDAPSFIAFYNADKTLFLKDIAE